MAEAYVTPDIASLMGLIDTFCRWKSQQQIGSRKYFAYHPSEWGKCLRMQQYKHFVQLGYVNIEQVGNAGQKERVFDTGHTMHHRWQQDYFARIVNILRGYWKCANKLCYAFDNEGKNRFDTLTDEQIKKMWDGMSRVHGTKELQGIFKPDKCVCGCPHFEYQEVNVVSEEMNFHGHADIILDFSRFDPSQFPGVRKTFNEGHFPKKPIVVDMKTINDFQFKNKLMKEGASKEYIIQVTIYAHLLDCEYGVLIYENKNDSTAVPHKVERNDDIFDTVKRQAQMMKALAAKRLLPPPRPMEKSDSRCGYCEFASLCHKSAAWQDKELDRKRKMFYGNLL